jgi:hypothetical protein
MSEKPPKKGAKSPGRSDHGCAEGHGRQRAVTLSVRRAQCKTLDAFVPVANRRGGNMAQLQEMLQRQDGIHVKKGQVYNAPQGKSGTVCADLASHRMTHSWIAFMVKKDPEGTHVIENDWLDGKACFRHLFAAPSATKKVRCFNHVCLPTV